MERENSKKQRHDSEKQVVVQVQVAPFVAKTYEMVNEQRTNGLIRWGRENNSFLVLDPAELSLLLLPSYFKHNNFSSFVRQLNAYVSTHLLCLTDGNSPMNPSSEAKSISYHSLPDGKSKPATTSITNQGMSKRLQVTEDRPHQLISFLIKIAEDPELLPRLIHWLQ